MKLFVITFKSNLYLQIACMDKGETGVSIHNVQNVLYFSVGNYLKTTRQLIAVGLYEENKKCHEKNYQGNAPGTQQSVKEKNY